MVHLRQLLITLPLLTIPVLGSAFHHNVKEQLPIGTKVPGVEEAEHDGFYFENPETDCKYVSQPYIYKAFKTLETDMSRLFTLIHRDVHFTVVGSHPIAGIYHDLMHFYVNALRRVAVVGSEHAEKFRVIPKAIHGGCNQEWSVEEMNFQGLSNSGTPFDIINVWVTRWSEKEQMVEVRTYVDSSKVTQLLHENENWWNSTRHVTHLEWMPGPSGMPNLTELYALMPPEDRPQEKAPGEGLTGHLGGYLTPDREETMKIGK